MTEVGSARRPVSLSERAYQVLRDRLVALHYGPMEPLNERELSEDLGIGLSPIREALRRLEYEKLVEIYPRRGTFAAGIGLSDQRSIEEMRLALEALAMRLACERATVEERAQLVELANRHYAPDDGKGMIDGDAEFHRLTYRVCRNRFLEASLNQHFNLALKVWYLCTKNMGPTPGGIHVDNSVVAKAIYDNDPDAAVAAVTEHIIASGARARRLTGADAPAERFER